MKLYGAMLSPFVMRVVLTARAKGIDLPVEMPEGGLKTDAYLALNPMGKMPCLVDGDFALPESAVIIDYVEEVGGGGSIYPADPQERARVRLLCRMADLYIVPELVHLFRARENRDAVPGALERLGPALANLDRVRRDSDVFAVGDRFTAADATLIPIFFFFDAFAKPFGTDKLVAAQPRLEAWWARAKASELGSRALAEQAEGMKALLGR
jgi:glutathione S-transferase